MRFLDRVFVIVAIQDDSSIFFFFFVSLNRKYLRDDPFHSTNAIVPLGNSRIDGIVAKPL